MRNLLKKGNTGNDVKTLQESLGLKADGIFGAKTEIAVKLFQSKHGLAIDGLVGPSTQVMIFKESLEGMLDSEITETQHNLMYMDSDEYLSGPNVPEYLFIHHTAGRENPYKTIRSWNNDSRGRIGTEFVIGGQSIKGDTEFDGEIVKCIPDGGYAWHLGPSGSQHMHVNSVGIELNNFGYLTKHGNIYKTYTGNIVRRSQVCDLGFEFRGHRYYHKYSDAQLDALRGLILYVSRRDNIDITQGLLKWLENELPIDAFGFKTVAWSGSTKGLLTHSNVRSDKSDMSPQPNLINMLLTLRHETI